MTFNTSPWSADIENELGEMAREACASAKKNKQAYDALLLNSKAAMTYDEKKHVFKLLNTALHFWTEQMEQCRALRKAYIEYRRLR